MIKICKGLYIHFTIVLLFAVCYFNRKLETMLVSYSVIFFHELAHLAAALLIGLRPSHITLFPFGVNLKLKNSLVYAISDEILLYLSGPLLNGIFALLSVPFLGINEYFTLFYYNNSALFIFNILPILPMDGGVVLKKILTRRVGYRCAEKILKTLSVVLILALVICQVLLLIKNNFNFSVLFATIFLTGNIFTNKEKYHQNFTAELMFYNRKDKKKIKRVKGYLIKNDANLMELVKNFSLGSNYVIFKEAASGEVEQILTEREIIEELLK